MPKTLNGLAELGDSKELGRHFDANSRVLGLDMAVPVAKFETGVAGDGLGLHLFRMGTPIALCQLQTAKSDEGAV